MMTYGLTEFDMVRHVFPSPRAPGSFAHIHLDVYF